MTLHKNIFYTRKKCILDAFKNYNEIFGEINIEQKKKKNLLKMMSYNNLFVGIITRLIISFVHINRHTKTKCQLLYTF